MAPMVEGVRQSNLGALELSLLALLVEYESGDAAHKRAVRKLVTQTPSIKSKCSTPLGRTCETSIAA